MQLEWSLRARHHNVLEVGTGSVKLIENHVFVRPMVLYSDELSPKHLIAMLYPCMM